MSVPNRRAGIRDVGVIAAIVVVVGGMMLAGCQPPQIDDPVAVLSTPQQSPRLYRAALVKVADRPLSDDELQVLRGMMHRPGYTPEVRERALDILAEQNPDQLKATIDFRLPTLGAEPFGALQWRRRLCEIIAERGWIELSPALVRAWAIPMAAWVHDPFERPEYLALAQLHGRDRVIDVVFDLLVKENSVAKQGLRTSCWTLLYQLGQGERLLSLLEQSQIDPQDGMLQDLRAAAIDLGIIPANREEILWIRELRQPERREFWNQAAGVISGLPADRRDETELRDLAILIAVANHEPDLLSRPIDSLYKQVDSYISTQTSYISSRDPQGYAGTNEQRLSQHREKLTWGDLAAMLMAVRAMRVPEVVRHLFLYAEEDREDRTTEYGGVIRLDEKNRFEVVEFRPRVRFHDNRFESSQAMMEAGYEAVFHFHFHAQKHDNDTYAGPGYGDLQYADNTRANCLVMTFIDADTMNIDFYRYDRVVVDLGEIRQGGN